MRNCQRFLSKELMQWDLCLEGSPRSENGGWAGGHSPELRGPIIKNDIAIY